MGFIFFFINAAASKDIFILMEGCGFSIDIMPEDGKKTNIATVFFTLQNYFCFDYASVITF